jgi:hypothetical protein
MQPDRATREMHVRKLCARLVEQIQEFTSDDVLLDRYVPGDPVEFAHKRFLRECGRYEDGTGTSDEVLTAAYALRDAWRAAVEAEDRQPQRAA